MTCPHGVTEKAVRLFDEADAEVARQREEEAKAEAYDRLLAAMRAMENEPMPEYRQFVAEMDQRHEVCEFECSRFICWRKCCFPPQSYGEVLYALCHQCRKQCFPRPEEHEHAYVCSICLRELAVRR